MKTASLEKVFARRYRILIHTLIISGTFNFALIATFITLVLRERKGVVLPQTAHKDSIKKITLSHQEIIAQYVSMPFEKLVKELYDETHVEQGLRKCDLALSCLTAFHAFDLERALPGFTLQKREWTCIPSNQEEAIVLTLYPGLADESLKAIQRFAHTEIWPLTSRGLYQQLRTREKVPSTLKEALMTTTELHHLKRQLLSLPYLISDETLLDLVKVCEWESLEKKSTLPDFLVPCIEQDSQLAAYLLVLIEKDYALTQLNNTQMEKLLELLTEKTPEIEGFLKEVAHSLRPNELKELAGKPPIETTRTYTVQYGDSLWKISRKFGVKVEMLRALNRLESDHLKLGAELILPSKESIPTDKTKDSSI